MTTLTLSEVSRLLPQSMGGTAPDDSPPTTFGGRVYSFIGSFCLMITDKEHGSSGLKKIAKVAYAVFLIIEFCYKEMKFFAKNSMCAVCDFLDGFDVVEDIRDIMTGEFFARWKKGVLTFFSHAVLMASNVTSAMILMEAVKLVKWANVAAKLGNVSIYGVKVFAFLGKLSLERLVRQSAALGFTLVTIDNLIKIAKGEDKYKSGLAILHAVPETALQLALLANGVGAGVLALRLGAALFETLKEAHTVHVTPKTA